MIKNMQQCISLLTTKCRILLNFDTEVSTCYFNERIFTQSTKHVKTNEICYIHYTVDYRKSNVKNFFASFLSQRSRMFATKSHVAVFYRTSFKEAVEQNFLTCHQVLLWNEYTISAVLVF